ncbi:MAG: calcium/sodium antiporter [Actinomycetota bacterium]
MVVAGAFFLGGLVLLLVAGNLVVRGASALGVRFGLAPNVIGLTIVAAGTSAPELAVVNQAVSSGDAELAVGSVVGSNIANVLLVLGLAAVLGAITVAGRVVRIDIPVMLLTTAAFVAFAWNRSIARVEGIVLLTGLVAFTVWTIRAARTVESAEETPPLGLGRSIVELVGGIALLALAAQLVVSGASDIAESLGVPNLVIGLTVVAIGTSAPEIVTTVVAAARGQRDLAVGNAVGSNIYNILLVLGLTASITPSGIDIADSAFRLDVPVMAAAAFACLPLVALDRRLDRWEGIVFVSYYAAYLTFLVLEATGNRAAEPFALIMLGFVMPITAITVGVVLLRQVKANRRRRATMMTADSTAPSAE